MIRRLPFVVPYFPNSRTESVTSKTRGPTVRWTIHCLFLPEGRLYDKVMVLFFPSEIKSSIKEGSVHCKNFLVCDSGTVRTRNCPNRTHVVRFRVKERDILPIKWMEPPNNTPNLLFLTFRKSS